MALNGSQMFNIYNHFLLIILTVQSVYLVQHARKRMRLLFYTLFILCEEYLKWKAKYKLIK